MKRLRLSIWALITAACTVSSAPLPSTDQTTVLVVVGAAGQPEFGSNFLRQALLWQQASAQSGGRFLQLGLDQPGPTNDYDRLRQTLAAEPTEGPGELWLVLIGHGTFDGHEARFNLRGPDLSATELALWLQPFRRPLAVLDTSPASAPFLNKLSGTNRVLLTATRSGHEQNFTHFGQFLSEAITDPQADLDKDGQVSLLEAFLFASSQVGEFYKTAGRLATEHALLDDNGDGLGTPADWFRGVRAIKKPRDKATVDGLLAGQFHLVRSPSELQFSPPQRARRDALEQALFRLRERKPQLLEADYYRELEKLLLELARFYQAPSP